MKTSLQKLVSSLSATEKKYFKQQCAGNGNGKQYVKLFDLMVKAGDRYSDEQAARKLGVKQIRVLKFRLYEQLLASQARSFVSNEEYRRPDINQVKALKSKRLLDDAIALLEKQLKTTQEAEDFYQVLQLLDLKEILVSGREEKKFNTAMLLAIHAEKEKYLQLQQHVQQLEKLRGLLIRARIEHTPDRNGIIPGLYARYLEAHKSWMDVGKMTTISQKCLYHEVSFLESDYEQDVQKARMHSLERIALHQSRPKPALLTAGSFAATLNNHLVFLGKNRLMTEAVPFIRIFMALRSPDQHVQAHIFFSSHVGYTNYLIIGETVTYTEADLAAIENQYNGIYSRRHEKEMTLKFNVAVLYFRLRKYKKARGIFFRLLTDPAQQHHIGFYANMLFLLCLFELKEADVFENEAASFINAHKKKGADFLFELTLVELLKNLLAKNSTQKVTKQALLTFYEEKAAAMLKGKYSQALDYFDFERYLQGKF